MKGSLQYKCASAVLPQLDWEDTHRLYKDTYNAIMRFFVAHLKVQLNEQTQDPEVLEWINDDIVSINVKKEVKYSSIDEVPRIYIITTLLFNDDTEIIEYSYKIDEDDNNRIYETQLMMTHDYPKNLELFLDSFKIHNDMLLFYDTCFNTDPSYEFKIADSPFQTNQTNRQ